MEKFLSIVEENFSFINSLKEQSEAEIEKSKMFIKWLDEQFHCSALRISFN